MSLNAILQQLYFTGFVLFFFFGFLQLSLRNRLHLNFALALLFFSGGYELFYYWAYISRTILRISYLMNTEIALSYLIGPVFYFYFSMALGFNSQFKKRDIIHAVPFILSLCLIVIINYFARSENFYEHFRYEYFPFYEQRNPLFLIATFSDISISGYILMTLFRIFKLLKGETPEKEIRLMIVFLFLMIMSSVLLILGGMSRLIFFLILGVGSFTVIGAVYVLFSFRYPELSMKVLREAKILQQNKSNIKNIDVSSILENLNALMENEKLYLQENINLKFLSSRLKITSHQLSRILNEYLQVNFRTYINSYRIKEAIALLESSPELGILEISIAAGFNSKSSFYTAFQKETGCLPAEYRKK